MSLLQNKVALITGAGSGMGQNIALKFLAEGARVITIGRTEKKLEETKKLANDNERMTYFSCDVSNEDEVRELFNKIERSVLVPTIIVNCAGVINEKRSDGGLDDRIVIDVNLFGVMNICENAIRRMISLQTGGIILNIASIAGHDGSSEFHSYAASKGAVLAYTKSIAMAYGKYNIRANTISPGVVLTPMSYKETPNYNDYIPELISRHPLGRLGCTEDIANAALFFCSGYSEWITGQDLIIDGGYTLRE